MNLNGVYYHGINPTSETNVDLYNLNASLKTLCRIIKNKHIYSLHHQGEYQRECASFADIDKVCICKDMRDQIKSAENIYNCSYDAYSMYVLYRYSIILQAQMQGVHKPNLYTASTIRAMSAKNYKKMLDHNCTDLFDEFRTSFFISLEKDAIAIGVPFFATYVYYQQNRSWYFEKCLNHFATHLEKIQKTLYKSKLKLPIVDSELGTKITQINQEYIDMLEEKSQKKRILVNL